MPSPNLPSPTILQIIPRLDTGGAELTTLEVTEALVRAGARALVATEGGRMADEVKQLGGEIVPFPAASKNPAVILANARRLTGLIAREGIGLLHARSRAPAWSALRAARAARIPWVTTYHGAYAGTGPIKTWYNSVMARADLVIANSSFTAARIRAMHGTDPDRIRIIPRGVDLARFDRQAIPPERTEALRQAWGLEPGRPVVLQAARLAGWKGQRVVIEAARQALASGALGEAAVILAGDAQTRGDYLADLERRIAAAGLTGRVRLVGHCADIAAAYALADVVVVASTEPEAFGRATTEALAMGCPVIASDHGAPAETVLAAPRHGPESRIGWLVPPGDATALAGALEEALHLPAPLRSAMVERARQHVAAHFTVGRLQRATLAVYDELLGTALAPRLAPCP